MNYHHSHAPTYQSFAQHAPVEHSHMHPTEQSHIHSCGGNDHNCPPQKSKVTVVEDDHQCAPAPEPQVIYEREVCAPQPQPVVHINRHKCAPPPQQVIIVKEKVCAPTLDPVIVVNDTNYEASVQGPPEYVYLGNSGAYQQVQHTGCNQSVHHSGVQYVQPTYSHQVNQSYYNPAPQYTHVNQSCCGGHQPQYVAPVQNTCGSHGCGVPHVGNSFVASTPQYHSYVPNYNPVPASSDALFNRFDRNKDNYMDFEEFKDFMRSIGISQTEQEARNTFRLYDTTGSGRVSRDEFRKRVYG